jgi:peptidoglycan/xylan/chitin deacetylase (PgdA/CDA1 family)
MATLGRFARALTALPGVDRLVRSIDQVAPVAHGGLTVLTYHRVGRPTQDAGLPSLFSATPEEFDQHLEAIAERFRPISVDELLARRDRPDRLPPRAVLVTIDDAYAGTAEVIWPRLREAGVPAVLFVPTAFPGTQPGFWWDQVAMAVARTSERSIREGKDDLRLDDAASRRRATRRLVDALKDMDHEAAVARAEQLIAMLSGPGAAAIAPPRTLDWQRLRTLAAEGLAMAPHSRTHPMLDRLASDRLDDEIAGSREDLVEQIGHPAEVFAYPSGRHSPVVVDAVRRAGFRAAFTTRRATNRLADADWFRLARINVALGSRPATIEAQAVAGRLLELARPPHATLADRPRETEAGGAQSPGK